MFVYGPVYEETAGLMVNDPVLRTHKVSLSSFSISVALSDGDLTMLSNEYCICISAVISGVGTWNFGKYF